MNLDDYLFHIKMTVRDYEADYQGIVNNANYLHYLEHTRHEFCKKFGLTFSGMHDSGLDPVVRRAEIEYRASLRMDEEFYSCLKLERHGPKFIFIQDIYRSDGTLAINARITVVCLENGRLSRGERMATALGI